MKKIRKFLSIALGCGALSCSQSTQPKSAVSSNHNAQVVASVDGQPITVGELQAEVERRHHGRKPLSVGSGEYEAVLQNMMQCQSVYARAVAEGFDQRPGIKSQIRALIVSRYLAQKLDKPLEREVGEDEIQRYYDDHADQFAVPEQVRFSVIKISVSPKATAVKRAEAFDRVEAIREQARAGDEGFETLVQRHSEDQATRYQGGDAGWIAHDRPGRWEAPVVAAAFSLPSPGDLSPIIPTADALYLVKLVERKPATRRPLAEVKSAIAYQLGMMSRRQAEALFFNQVKAGQKIEINRALFESLPMSLQQTESKPPEMPGG